jgi:hypothetical protein
MTPIEEIKARLSLQAALEHFGAHVPYWRDRPFTIPCFLPGHEDKTPSLTVYPRDDRAWCYGCNRGGDLLDITALMLNTDIQGAVEYWSRRFNLSASRPDPAAVKEMEAARLQRRVRQDAHALSLAAERDIPCPHDPGLLDIYDYIFDLKEEIDVCGADITDELELRVHLAALEAWQRRALMLLERPDVYTMWGMYSAMNGSDPREVSSPGVMV